MSTPATGFRNLGASCFVNAGLQLVFAVPGFVEAVANGHSETEKAVKAAAELLIHHPRSSSVPTSVTDIFYRGVQEDMAEFVVRLLDRCQSTHAMMRGQETAKLRCRHCGFSRSLPPEAFLTLQVPLTTTTSSVQQALDNYLATECVQANVEEWFCVNDVCLDSGIAEEDPVHVTSINKWPDVLLLCVKRWDALRGLIAQQIHCSTTLSAGGNEYRLQALATHIGATPSSGHYVAYRRRGAGFVQLNDHMVSPLKAQDEDFFVTMPDEKVYMLAYVKNSAETRSTAPVAMPKFNFKRPPRADAAAIDLDSDTDSDVVTVFATPPTSKRRIKDLDSDSDKDVHRSQTQQGGHTRLRGLQHYTDAELTTIAVAIRNGTTFSQVLQTLKMKMPKLNLEDKSSTNYLSPYTLRNWIRKPANMETAIAKVRQERLQQPKGERKPKVGSVRKTLTNEHRKLIGDALQCASSWPHLLAILKETLPGFSCDDKTASCYIPHSTLHSWLDKRSESRWLDEPEPTTWSEEHEQNFSVAFDRPAKRQLGSTAVSDVNGLWLRNGSWVFCPACGRRHARVHTDKFSLKEYAASSPCYPFCDPTAEDLLTKAPVKKARERLRAYVTPQVDTWRPWCQDIANGNLPLTTLLTKQELQDLAVLDIHVDYQSRRGGHAVIQSKQKRSVVRCRWHASPLRDLARDNNAARAFTWLLQNNDTYKGFVDKHAALIQERGKEFCRDVPTAALLLGSPGIEVAVRPWLYPLASFADSDLQQRLCPLGWTDNNSKPSIRAGFMRKLLSRCLDYSRDFPLQCLMYDTCMARTISSVQSIADQKKVSPEQIASDMDAFDAYWSQQLRKMEDICRQEWEKTGVLERALPSVFFTVAPAEWRYILHDGMFCEESLTDQQGTITLHLYHTLQTLLDFHLFKNGQSLERIGVAKIRQWSFRFEFQSRGTLHLHAVLWADLLPGWSAENITGRTGTQHNSPFVALLEDLFKSRADVQCGDGSHNLLMYVAGYLQKASDALAFNSKQAQHEGTQAQTSRWRQTYRLLCKKSPMEQEIIMEFAGLPMVKHSFTGHALFAPIPGSQAANSSRDQYSIYQFYLTQDHEVRGCARGMSYMQWLRRFRVVDVKKKIVANRNQAPFLKNCSCGIAMSFPFELLDIFIGAWAATFMESMPEYRLLPNTTDDNANYGIEFLAERTRRASFQAPQGCQHLKAILCLDEFQVEGANPEVFHPEVGKLLTQMETELIFRGIGSDRIATFKARVHACAMLLLSVRDGREDPMTWTARPIAAPPQRNWSVEQQQVLTSIRSGTSISDAAVMETSSRILQVSGGPGTGKTEVIIAAARQALDDGCRVLIAGPIGLLVSMYRLRLPNSENLTMETIHSAFRIVRDADAAYIPPGRLRQYDLIIFDEISQVEASTWAKLKTALGELSPCPFVVFVGDFQQLQPLAGGPALQQDLHRQVEAKDLPLVELHHHEAARSVDPDMLAFLEVARVSQPSRSALEHFFRGRVWSSDVQQAAQAAERVENAGDGIFTFLTVTNRGAASLNLARLALEFPSEAEIIRNGGGVPAEVGNVVIAPRMRLRLTRNVDKDRGFVNGNTGIVRTVLRKDVFVLDTAQGIPILAHPITQKGRKFLPVAYGWATTMRRAQGATLDKVGLWFDRRLPDRGYAYVGLSRAKRREDVFLVGRVRRTDWRPVNGADHNEQNTVSALSETSDSEDERSTESSD
ncbi:USP17L21, partial [Symbiodinium pilosum]